MLKKRLFPALLLVFACSWAWAASDDMTPLKFGGAETGFKDLDGNSRLLSEFTGKGKWTIVMIWASDCHVCNEEIHNYVGFHNKHKDKNATVLGLSADGWSGRAAAQGFIDRHKVSFPSLLASASTIIALYKKITGENLPGTPAFLVFDPNGKIAAKQVGPVEVEIIENFIAQSR